MRNVRVGFLKSSKVNKFGTLLKVKCLILLNIFSVFPTHVGMFRCFMGVHHSQRRLPHACWDVPVPVPCPMMMSSVSSPRMWGFHKKQKFLFLLAYRKCFLYKCFQRTDTCRFSFKSFVCVFVPSEFQCSGQGMGVLKILAI